MQIVTGTLLTLIGLIVAMKGRRARRIDDHPWCRKCRFDLHGRWPDVQTCPECGESLKQKHAVGQGRRRARPTVVVAGLLVLGLGLALAASGGWSQATGKSLNPYKPTWWLLMEADAPSIPIAHAAVQELDRRLAAGRLAPGRTLAIVDDALALQAEPAAIWLHSWGDFIETAQSSSILDAPRWQRYLEQGPRMMLTARPKVRESDPLPVRISLMTGRLGSNPSASLTFSLAAIRADGAELPVRSGGFVTQLPTRPSQNVEATTQASKHGLATGAHEIEVLVDMSIAHPLGPSDPWVLDFPVRVEVLPDGAVLINETNDPKLEESIRESITVPLLLTRINASGEHSLNVTFRVSNAPTDLALRATALSKEGAWPLGSMTVEQGETTDWALFTMLDTPVDGEALDIMLEADPEAAARTVELDAAWLGTILLRDQPLRHLDAAGRVILPEQTLEAWARTCATVTPPELVSHFDQVRIELRLEYDCAPVALPIDVILRNGDESIELGLASVKGRRGSCYVATNLRAAPAAMTYDVVLRVDPEAAADLDGAWHGEVVLERIELRDER